MLIVLVKQLKQIKMSNRIELTQEEVYQLFDKEFLVNHQFDALFQHIIYCLSKGMSQIEIIKMLLDDRKACENTFKEVLERRPPVPITINFENLPEKIKNDMKKFNKNERKYY